MRRPLVYNRLSRYMYNKAPPDIIRPPVVYNKASYYIQ